jgi:hypothetical protein
MGGREVRHVAAILERWRIELRRLRSGPERITYGPSNGGTSMARKPNYDFERRERERLKNLKNAARAEAKLKPPAEEAGEVAKPDEDSKEE